MKNYFIITILTIILNTNAYSDHKIEEQKFSGVSYLAPSSNNYQNHYLKQFKSNSKDGII